MFGLMLLCRWGHAVAHLVEALRYKPMESLRIFTNLILQAAVWPWCQLSLKEALSTRCTLWGKGGWCTGLTALLPYVPIV